MGVCVVNEFDWAINFYAVWVAGSLRGQDGGEAVDGGACVTMSPLLWCDSGSAREANRSLLTAR